MTRQAHPMGLRTSNRFGPMKRCSGHMAWSALAAALVTDCQSAGNIGSARLKFRPVARPGRGPLADRRGKDRRWNHHPRHGEAKADWKARSSPCHGDSERVCGAHVVFCVLAL